MFADKGQHFSPALLTPRFLSSQTWEVCLSLLLYRPLGREPTVLWGKPNLIFLLNEYWCYGPRLLAIRDIHCIWPLPDMSQFSQYSVRIFPAWYFQLSLITRVLLLKWRDFRDSRAPWEPHCSLLTSFTYHTTAPRTYFVSKAYDVFLWWIGLILRYSQRCPQNALQ